VPCLRRVLDAPLPRGWRLAVVVVDDASGAASANTLADARAMLESSCAGNARGAPPASGDLARPLLVACEVLQHSRNRGKGAALRTGFDWVLQHGDDADLVVIQDADLEYDPRDFAPLVAAAERCDAAAGAVAVFGNRWASGAGAPRRLWHRIHRLGNATLTTASNLATGYALADMECCYKMMPVAVLRRVRPMLTEDRFGVEPQLTAVRARIGVRIDEVAVRYDARAYRQGKKIGVRDALRTMWVIVRERFRAPAAQPPHGP
jgi:glycosyltransferase involved in cell wall biosynthesis